MLKVSYTSLRWQIVKYNLYLKNLIKILVKTNSKESDKSIYKKLVDILIDYSHKTLVELCI